MYKLILFATIIAVASAEDIFAATFDKRPMLKQAYIYVTEEAEIKKEYEKEVLKYNEILRPLQLELFGSKYKTLSQLELYLDAEDKEIRALLNDHALYRTVLDWKNAKVKSLSDTKDYVILFDYYKRYKTIRAVVKNHLQLQNLLLECTTKMASNEIQPEHVNQKLRDIMLLLKPYKHITRKADSFETLL